MVRFAWPPHANTQAWNRDQVYEIIVKAKGLSDMALSRAFLPTLNAIVPGHKNACSKMP